MDIIDLATIALVPWRNGAGVTRPVASGSAGQKKMQNSATIDDADWRISLAELHSDGPFSLFPGIDRHAVLIGDAPVLLKSDTGSITAQPLAPISYAGETAFYAVCGTPARTPQFLNLMVRRGTATVNTLVTGAPVVLTNVSLCCVMPVSGAWCYQSNGTDRVITAGQAGIAHDIGASAQWMPLTPDSSAIVMQLVWHR